VRGAENAERQRDGHRNHHGRDRELDRRGGAGLQQLDDRLATQGRAAEIALEQVANPHDVLDQQRLV